ncbi:carbon-nitrogen hydrolase family protein [Bradyrhizobium sp. CCBAU 51627]|uniref:carbon-nitrogen hydrolase family protein n=1 Tax=Bradyrhizobium sp. CCBAU 51627 TaxID=1325088 RepID=UPI002306CDCA|nr:carbon-nitrogen hydrolase family protein [Bradyrhizobium sp. CCBAU 51627]MDA9431418.1 aliphatic nitrilase [Bradyrhizobium sp. CCBAU 51627]
MVSTLPRFKAAACHTSSVFLDAAKTAEKACDLIAEAARNGASLVAFPESFIPGFPVWAALQAPIMSHDFFGALSAQALLLDSPELTRIRMAAKRHGVVVSVGFTEGTVASLGCIWNSNLLVGEDGSILNHHRKLVPTFYEKLVWAAGDARGLRVAETKVGRVGMLICGENTNPLARYSLMAQGEQVHISTYPPIWPTRPSKQQGGYDLRKAIEIRAGAHSFEAKCFNIVSSACVDVGMRDALAQANPAMLDLIEGTPHAVSMILDPTGQVISEVLSESEGIAYADIDVARCVEPKQFHDVVGYYNRFDVFSLTVDRSQRDPAIFVEVEGQEPGDRSAQHRRRETLEPSASEFERLVAAN